ncbi:hypothetical protein WDU94_004318 [Cyamophila willieti]
MESSIDDYEEEDRNKKKIINDQMQAKLEALKQEVASMKEFLDKTNWIAEEKEEHLKTFQYERKQVKEKAESRKKELGKKLEEIRKKNEQMIQDNEDAQEARNKKEEEMREKKKKDTPDDTTPVVSEELQAQYQEQISELTNKLDATKMEISIIVNKNQDIERQIEEAKDKGEDITNQKKEYQQQIVNLGDKLVEMSREKNRLLKEKEEMEEQLKLRKMSKHAEKGNSMIGEIEDGNKIMLRNLKIVNQKCCEVKKRIALKQFELNKLKESYANLLYDLKKKNNYSNSAYGVVQGEIDEYKQKIRALEGKMEEIVHMDETVPFPDSGDNDDNLIFLNNIYMSKEKAFREAVKECQEVARKTFSKRESLFHLECEFRKRKTELRDWQNKIARRKEELKSAIEENENKLNGEIKLIEEEIHMEQIGDKSNLNEQQIGHEENQSAKITSDLENVKKKPSSSRNSEIVQENNKEESGRSTKSETAQENDKVEASVCKSTETRVKGNTKDIVETITNQTSEKLPDKVKLQNEPLESNTASRQELSANDLDIRNSLDVFELKDNGENASLNSSIYTERDLAIKAGNSSPANNRNMRDESINTTAKSNHDEDVSHESEANESLDKRNSSSENKEKVSIGCVNVSIEEKLANIENVDKENNGGALNNVDISIGNESTFIDENIVNRFKNVNSSIRKGNLAYSNCSYSDESSFDESNFGNVFKNVNSSINKGNNLANELMFAETGNLADE